MNDDGMRRDPWSFAERHVTGITALSGPPQCYYFLSFPVPPRHPPLPEHLCLMIVTDTVAPGRCEL